jgi:2-desacetyl-2-hydroxyethyl bacteriochlorophyllide A dehydrogenase
MKAAVFRKPYDIRVEEVPIPDISEDGLLVKVKACGICGTDAITYLDGTWATCSYPLDDGCILGHEFAGDCVKVGKNVKGIKVGDRISSLGFGAMAEYVCIEPNAIGIAPVILPDNLSYEEAATNDPLIVAYAAVRRGNPQPDDKVVVMGAGAVGLSAIQHLKADFPVKLAIAVDISEKRLEAAKKMGADIVINARKENVEEKIVQIAGIEPTIFLPKNASEISLVIDCAGAKDTMQLGLEILRPEGGRMVCVASYHDPIKIDPSYIVIKSALVMGSMNYASEDFAHGIELMASGRIDRKPFISHKIPLKNVKEAFELQCNVDESVKVLVIP